MNIRYAVIRLVLLFLLICGCVPHSAAQEIWRRRFETDWYVSSSATSVSVDGSDNVYVAGGAPRTNDQSTYHDFILLKYAKDGTKLWARRYTGPTNVELDLRAMTVDPSDNVYVTGTTEIIKQGQWWNHHIVTQKYDTSGSLATQPAIADRMIVCLPTTTDGPRSVTTRAAQQMPLPKTLTTSPAFPAPTKWRRIRIPTRHRRRQPFLDLGHAFGMLARQRTTHQDALNTFGHVQPRTA